ncbi:MAG TPA: hypothetical protein ENN47_03580 [Mesotoga infera]|uniref:Prepilin-type N-terminal cleavage/methylation domain-containing protein n=1 Tax=Mesotoga infera TaxID=1236046 RepID=A0A7C1GPE6_9BACT|nr:hypothetical protein [Mesotoga infera]
MKKGISLIEMVVSLAVSALLLISIFKIANLQLAMSFSIVKETKAYMALSRTFDILERDLSRSTGNFSWGISFISFDAIIEGEYKRIRYYVSGNRIMRRSGNSYNTVTEFRKSAGFFEEEEIVRFIIDEREILIGIEGG